jgi:thymidylate synthase ThyX
MQIDLRNFVETIRKRSSSRVQGEYRAVLNEMKELVLQVHPWTELFFERTFDKAADELDIRIGQLNIPDDQKTAMVKLLDQLRITQ